MAIEQKDLEKAVEIVNTAWVDAVNQTIDDKTLSERVKAIAGVNMLRNFLSFFEAEVENEFPKETPKLSDEDIAQIKKWKKEHGE